MVGIVLVAAFLFGNQALNKIADLRYRFQLLERRVDSLGEVVSAPLKRNQENSLSEQIRFKDAKNGALDTGYWKLIGGSGTEGNWSGEMFLKAKAMQVHKSDLYVGLLGSQRGSAAIWRFNGTQWKRIADADIIPGWKQRSYVQVLHSIREILYAGVDDEIWSYEGKAWNRFAGASGKFPWPSSYTAYTLTHFNGHLYVGLTGDSARVFRFNEGDWEEVSDGLPGNLTQGVYELFAHTDNNLYAAVTNAAGPGQVYRLDGSNWTLVGGGTPGSWISNGFNYPLCLTSYQDRLIVTLNRNPQIAGQFVSVWANQNEKWAPVGLKGIPEIWSETDNFNACTVFKNRLYVAGGGRPAGNAGVYALTDKMKWRQIGGNGINNSWSAQRERMSGWRANAEYVYRLVEWRGLLIAGFGDGPDAAQVWAFTPDEVRK